MSENVNVDDTSESELPPVGMMFDEKLKTLLADTCRVALLQVPELRSIIVGFDYRRNLNDSPTITKGLWVSGEGAKKSADTVIGTLGVMVHVIANVVDASMSLQADISQQVTEVSRLLLERKTELAAIEARIRDIRVGQHQAVPGDAVTENPGPPEDQRLVDVIGW